MRALTVSFVLMAGVAWAQPATTPVPEKHIPGSVLLELRAVESQFDLALARDCAPERCFSKGCVYRDHTVVDLPRNTSLPGLQAEQGLGALPPQEYLTQVHCEFAHEKSVSAHDVTALSHRLEQQLSKGWLQVTVGRQLLEPIPASLSVSPLALPEPAPPAKTEAAAPIPPPPPHWEAEVALRELWVTLLPHFAWMIAIFLVTVSALFMVWSARRLGKESLEEKALAKQLEAQGSAPSPEAAAKQKAEEEALAAAPSPEDEAKAAAFVADQQRLWAERISHAELSQDKGGVNELLRSWLEAKEFALLAKATTVFGDRLSLAFSSDGELAARKVEFAQYLKDLDDTGLPTDADFFKKLNQHAISSTLLAQADAEIYRSLREEFGSSGVAHLIEKLPPRSGALLFALVPPDNQHEVARVLSSPLRLQVAGELLRSNRITRQDREYLFETLDAARSGLKFEMAPEPGAHEITDRGREFDAAGALSVLFQHIDAEERSALYAHALERNSGVFPRWYENILYPEMLMKLSTEVRSDLLLEVDIKGLAGWSSLQQPQSRDAFIGQLSQSLQNAVKANLGFSSRAQQLSEARRGHDELVSALKRLTSRGKVTFQQMVA